MSAFLVGAADANEARRALAAGADSIDVVGTGPLARVPAILAAVDGRCPVGARLDCPPGDRLELAEALAAAGIVSLKIVLAPDEHRVEAVAALAAVAGRLDVFAIFLADREPFGWPLALLHAARFAGAMLDVAAAQGGLIEHLGLPGIGAFVAACRDHRLLAGLSGRLETPDLPRLALLKPDLLGVGPGLAAEGLRDFRDLIPRSKTQAAPETRSDRVIDRIFVRDLVLPVSIGVYARERGKPQKVRFNVEVEVGRAAGIPAGVNDIMSYDLIIDAIGLIVAESHAPLVETLAETIAARVLAHPRARRAKVRVEKLEAGPAVVGVEIIRER